MNDRREKEIINVDKGTKYDINVEHSSDFISVYKNVFTPGYCEHMISEFERLANNGIGFYRHEKRHTKEDYAIVMSPGVHNFLPFKGKHCIEAFFDLLQIVFDNYSSRYTYLKDVQVTCSSMKMQRTDPGQGYHVFHAEQGNGNVYSMHQKRAVVYTLYLNTLDSDAGGETEFLYQKKRIAPVENTMIIWPAAYTHVHRGNTTLGDKSKYIITGWFQYD